ncbi:RAVE subunit 2/Rogdi [Hypoxylon trugodes]|uniref:RAVE subunit 2/Rogdi n=1 Tax=Hypoxylon trugodes TaxID=326681 RepID=UPI0021A1AA63|nr:RAVE subunit 2/Rogdi [Hypoxylon trugodes]KAI1392478.1 RAVE subunit 2/Rogdi [Hypoxylon trugodes]
MSVEIWPPISPDELKIQEDATQDRELAWLLTSLRSTLAQVKQGLEDCCALLSPTDISSAPAGSTLALTTPRNETVKGHATRIGTRLVRGIVHLRLRTLPPQTLSLDPSRPVRVAALTRLDALLARSVALCLDLEEHDQTRHHTDPPSAPYLAAQLRLLSQYISEAGSLVKGPPNPSKRTPPPSSSRPGTAASVSSTRTQEPRLDQQPQTPPDTSWTTGSISLHHFTPPLSRNLSIYLTIQDACLVLYLRALEPADAPVNFGTKLALAIGTTRRLEHDEADKVFNYRCDEDGELSEGGHGHGDDRREGGAEVYVREKVRVESADPSLLSLSAKLSALGYALGLARRNLAAVMGEEIED